MPDTKITALAAITTVDPAADVLPIVDISDTSMAASGTTKKITSNQILGAGGTATLASATITGAATVGTTLGVTGVSTFAAGTALLPALTTTGDTNTGIYYPAADTFAVTTGGTERYRVDSSGNLGIGVTPSAWSSSFKALQIGNQALWSVAGGNGYLSNNTTFNTSNAYVYRNNGFATEYIQSATNGVHAWFNAPSGTTGNAITFTQAMTLDASGRLFVGATSITAGYSGNNYLIVGGVTSPTIKLQSTTGPAAWDIYSAGGLDLFIAYNSSDKGQFSTTTGAYTALSDANKKRDFEPSNIGLAEVLKLQPKLFRMIDDSDDAPKQLGFVAQDVQSVIPQAYSENDGQGGKFIGLQDRPIIAALTRAIQELTARVQTLETR